MLFLLVQGMPILDMTSHPRCPVCDLVSRYHLMSVHRLYHIHPSTQRTLLPLLLVRRILPQSTIQVVIPSSYVHTTPCPIFFISLRDHTLSTLSGRLLVYPCESARAPIASSRRQPRTSRSFWWGWQHFLICISPGRGRPNYLPAAVTTSQQRWFFRWHQNRTGDGQWWPVACSLGSMHILTLCGVLETDVWT